MADSDNAFFGLKVPEGTDRRELYKSQYRAIYTYKMSASELDEAFRTAVTGDGPDGGWSIKNDERTAVLDDLNRVLAALHEVDVAAVGLSDYGPPGHYLERQVGRWSKQYRASETQDLPDMNRLMQRLVDEMPEDDGQRTLVHGDYRIDNMIFEADGTRCLAVLDWELSTIGHPFADLASVIMQWQLPPGNQGRGLMGVERGPLGLPSDEAFIAAYCARRGLPPIDNFGFYLGFCFFRMAAIIQGVLRRALDGNASNPARARQLGTLVPVFAANGLKALK